MKHALLSVMCLFVATAVAGPDLSGFAEGNASQRERLKTLEAGEAPALDVANWVNSQPETLANLKGKIVVLDFWATWCGPCIAGIPHTNELAEKFKDKVEIIGVCHPQGGENMAKMVKDKGIKYPVCLDTNGKTAKAYGVDGFPDYYIIDAAGKLVLADCSNAAVEKALEALTK